VPEENFWTLWCKGRLTEADTLIIRLGATPSGLSSSHLHRPPHFYRPDALPATQPTVSKHSRQEYERKFEEIYAADRIQIQNQFVMRRLIILTELLLVVCVLTGFRSGLA